MRTLLLAGVAACAVIAGSTSVFAADPPPAYGGLGYAYNWSGVYVGGQIGYVFGNADHSFPAGCACDDDSDPEGIIGGGHIGYNFQRDVLVFGIEGDVEFGDVDGSYQNPAGFTSSGSVDINVQGSVRGRIGYAMDRFLPYITAGVAFADVDYGGGPLGGPCCGFSDTAVGWTVGAGVQYAFTDMFSVRVEYRYTDFGTDSGGLAPIFPGVNMGVDLETHAIRAMFSINLGSLL